MRRLLVSLICLSFVAPGRVWSQAPSEGQERLRALEERIVSLEATVASLKTALETSAPMATPNQLPTAPSAPLASAEPSPPLGGAAGMAKALNPDIGVIGNFVGAAGGNAVAPIPALSMQETEIGFQAIVDPYSRADFFVSLGPEGAELEEGYITLTALPGQVLGKVGRMRSNFGKLNPLHNHVLPWVDRPLISANLLGGEEGIVDEGLHVSRILPAPAGLFLEGSAEVYQGNSPGLFSSQRRSDVSSIYRLRSYKDITESTNLEVAGSYARGHNDFGSDFLTQLAGADSTLRWKPLRRAIYHSFVARGEALWSRRAQPDETKRAFGYYASADYQFARRWFAGMRFDWAERARDVEAHDSSQSIVLTYSPSEFSQLRGQLRRTRYAEASTANEFLFQFQYNIGAHGAHPF
jgi:hypothetical protein